MGAEQKMADLNMRNEVESFLSKRTIPENTGFGEVSEKWAGRGIVTLSGRPLYLLNAYMNIRFIREFLGSDMPVELWYLGEEEIHRGLFSLIGRLGGVDFVDARERQKAFPMKPGTLGRIMFSNCPSAMDGWRNKSYAMVHSRFREMIFMDSDCFLFRRPDEVFSIPEYRECGAVFSADIDARPDTSGRSVDPKTFIVTRLGIFSGGRWDYSKKNPIWDIIGAEEDELPEFESGFILLDKTAHLDSLFLSLFLNENSDLVYRYVYGDKDTFHLAWAKNKDRCRVLTGLSRDGGHIVCRHEGSVLFSHRVYNTKFNPSVPWDRFPNSNDFPHREVFKEYFQAAVAAMRPKVF
jgi:hypothetical protein